jgi:hypothetical protein
VLHPSPTSQIFFTSTSHSTHYEFQEPLLCVVQVFDDNRSQSRIRCRMEMLFEEEEELWALRPGVNEVSFRATAENTPSSHDVT